MNTPKFRFVKRKSLADFTSENMPNQILCSCLKANTRIPDETILDAFNEAYPICIEVLADIRLHNARSDDFARLSANEPQSSLLRYCFVYFLLSFHEKAPELRRYLANLKDTLEERMPDIFKPILLNATSMAPMLPGTVFFDASEYTAIDEQPILNDTKEYVKIRNLIQEATRLPKAEAETVLHFLRVTVANECCDWDTIIQIKLNEVLTRLDDSNTRSKYYIADGQTRNFIKILKALFGVNIIVDEQGFYITNFSSFAIDTCRFFNTELKTPPHNHLNEARDTDNYMDIIDRFYKEAQDDYALGKALGKKGGKPTIKEHPQGSITF